MREEHLQLSDVSCHHARSAESTSPAKSAGPAPQVSPASVMTRPGQNSRHKSQRHKGGFLSKYYRLMVYAVQVEIGMSCSVCRL